MVASGDRPPFRVTDTGDGPPSRSASDVFEAAYTLGRKAAIEAHLDVHDRTIRSAQALCLAATAIPAVLSVSGVPVALLVNMVMVAATTVGVGGRRLVAKGIGDEFDRLSAGAGQLRYEMSIRPASFRLAGDAVAGMGSVDGVDTVAWSQLSYRQSPRYLLLSRPARGRLIIPLADLPPGFAEAVRQRVRAEGATEGPPIRPVPAGLRALQAIATTAVLGLAVWAMFADFTGWPHR